MAGTSSGRADRPSTMRGHRRRPGGGTRRNTATTFLVHTSARSGSAPPPTRERCTSRRSLRISQAAATGCARLRDQYHLVVVETAAQAALQQTGVRLTPQRLAIAAILAQTEKETSAQELYERVRKKHAYIGRATVFRSLDTLVSAGLAQRLERPGHVSAYVWCEPGHHHHLICTTCRTVEDLGEEAVAPLAETIARQRGFRVDHATLDFYGECPTF